MNPYILIIIALGLAFAMYVMNNTNNNAQEQDQPKDKAEKLPYSKKYLLTGVEYRFWNMLDESCKKNNLMVCPKVRMEDFINVNVADFKERQKYRGYIKSRHVDFLICDAKLVILAGVELDDDTHNSGQAKKTDTFKNDVFKAIGLPLFRIKTDPKQYEAEIEKLINELTSSETKVADTVAADNKPN